jgi:hypothetical protein
MGEDKTHRYNAATNPQSVLFKGRAWRVFC